MSTHPNKGVKAHTYEKEFRKTISSGQTKKAHTGKAQDAARGAQNTHKNAINIESNAEQLENEDSEALEFGEPATNIAHAYLSVHRPTQGEDISLAKLTTF